MFIAIATFWQANAEAWPSQESIANFTGYSSRAVRDYVDVLEHRGIVRTRRERRRNGADRIFYAPGLITLIELAAFVERFPRERPKPSKHVDVADVSATSSHPPEAVSGAPPEASSMEHRDLNLIEPSSLRAIASEEQNRIEVTDEDRAVARLALVERARRKHPKRPPPKWFDASEIALVAACSSAIEGDRETKLRAHREAIIGAFLASKDGPPTVRFIWEKLEHFFDHVDRGRTRVRAEERVTRCEPARSRPDLPAKPSIPFEQMHADIAAIFRPHGGAHVSR